MSASGMSVLAMVMSAVFLATTASKNIETESAGFVQVHKCGDVKASVSLSLESCSSLVGVVACTMHSRRCECAPTEH